MNYPFLITYLVLCVLFAEPVLAQLGNPGRSGTSDESRPDLSRIPASEAAAIESACGYFKRAAGPAAYYQCLQGELAALQKSPGRPDLSHIPASEAAAIESACGYFKRAAGPAAYYQCLRGELAALQKFLAPNTKRLETSQLATKPANTPPEEATAEKGIQQTEEVIRSEKSPNKQTIPSKLELESTPFRGSPKSRPLEKATAEKGKKQNEQKVLDQFDKLVQEQTNAEQKKLAPAKPEEKQREKSVDPKTNTGRYQIEELGKEPFADTASPKVPQATRASEPTKTDEKLFSLFAVGSTILFFIGSLIYRRILRKPCIHCNTRTKNLNRICDPCKIRMDYEKAKAQEREAQEREARIRGDEKNRWEEQAKAQEQRRRDNENARARERERQANEARKKAEENRRREEEQAQEERRRRDGARSNKQPTDPYEVLQVTRGASKEEIRTAYINMIKRYHPDRVSHLGKEFQDIAEKKAKEINEAYDTLTSG